MTRRTSITAVVFFACLALGFAFVQAQAPPATQMSKEVVQAPADQVPILSPVQQQQLTELRQRLLAVQWMESIVQRERDLVMAELQRTVQALQRPGYVLDWATGAYAPDPPKKK